MRGTIVDTIPIMVITFVLLIGLVVGSLLYTEFSQTDVWNETYSGDVETTLSVLDYGTLFIVIILGMSTVISAFFIKTHPVFFPVSLILLLVVLMISGPLTNAFMGVAQDEKLVDTSNQFTVTLQTLGNLPYIILVLSAMILIGLYAKPGGA